MVLTRKNCRMQASYQSLDSVISAFLNHTSRPRVESDYFTVRQMSLQSSPRGDEGDDVSSPAKRSLILELASSYEKHRLGKQQQVLHEVAARCREQEVTNLSTCLSSKAKLNASGKPERGITFYSTTHHLRTEHRDRDSQRTREAQQCGLKRSYTTYSFPVRSNPRCSHTTVQSSNGSRFPQVNIAYTKGLSPSDLYKRTRSIYCSKNNGTIQREHQNASRNDHVAPLMLPSIGKEAHNNDTVDKYICATKLLTGANGSSSDTSVTGGKRSREIHVDVTISHRANGKRYREARANKTSPGKSLPNGKRSSEKQIGNMTSEGSLSNGHSSIDNPIEKATSDSCSSNGKSFHQQLPRTPETSHTSDTCGEDEEEEEEGECKS